MLLWIITILEIYLSICIFEVNLKFLSWQNCGFLFMPFGFDFRVFSDLFLVLLYMPLYTYAYGIRRYIYGYVSKQSRSFCAFAFPFSCFKCIDPILWPERWNFVCISLKRFIYRQRFLSPLNDCDWDFNELKHNCICIIMMMAIRSLNKVFLHIYYTF